MAIRFLYDEDSRVLSDHLLAHLVGLGFGEIAAGVQRSLRATEARIEGMLDEALTLLHHQQTRRAVEILYHAPLTANGIIPEGEALVESSSETEINELLTSRITRWRRDGHEPYAPLNVIEALYGLFCIAVLLPRCWQRASRTATEAGAELVVTDESGRAVFGNDQNEELLTAGQVCGDLLDFILDHWSCNWLLARHRDSQTSLRAGAKGAYDHVARMLRQMHDELRGAA